MALMIKKPAFVTGDPSLNVNVVLALDFGADLGMPKKEEETKDTPGEMNKRYNSFESKVNKSYPPLSHILPFSVHRCR